MTDPRSGNTTFGAALETYEGSSEGKPGTLANKRMILKKIPDGWCESDDPGERSKQLPLRHNLIVCFFRGKT
jgi:hypothetical protein